MGQIIRFRRRKWSRISDYPTSRNSRKSPRKTGGWLKFAPLWGAAVLIGTAAGAGWIGGPKIVSPGSSFSPIFSHFGSCYIGGGRNCVVDGDTFWMNGVKIRIANIDAPETHPPRCARERELGFRATRRLRELLNSGRVMLTSIDRDEDVYGRKLRNVQVNGSDVGSVLVGEGLAHWYVRGKLPWC